MGNATVLSIAFIFGILGFFHIVFCMLGVMFIISVLCVRPGNKTRLNYQHDEESENIPEGTDAFAKLHSSKLRCCC